MQKHRIIWHITRQINVIEINQEVAGTIIELVDKNIKIVIETISYAEENKVWKAYVDLEDTKEN